MSDTSMMAPQVSQFLKSALLWGVVGFGLLGTLYFGIWWFQPGHVASWPLYLLLSLSLWFFILRAIGYWLIFAQIRPHRPVPAPRGLKVDAMTTAAPGEPLELTQASLLALKNMTYPHETYLLDDSANPRLRAFCRAHDIHYVSRKSKKDAKCGNVNHGLKKALGDFVLIVDPDHIVHPHYLDRVLGHFQDPTVGFVQTAQVYYNQDRSFVAKGGAEQTYFFYGPVMAGLGTMRSNLVIGTNCTFRRDALDSIGLYKPGLAEDLHTSMALHSRGWRSVYVPEVLARGLTPEDLSSFFHQQLKWSRGVLELLLNNFGQYARGWTWRQRALYALGMSYYLESVMFAINLVLPLFYLWGQQKPLTDGFDVFALHLLPWLVTSVFMFVYGQRWLCDPRAERGLMWRGLLLQFLSVPVHLLGILYAFVGRQIPYLPTAKTPSDVFPLKLMLPQAGVILLTLLGLVFGLCRTCTREAYEGMIGFAAWNVLVLAVGMAIVYVSHQRMFAKPLINWEILREAFIEKPLDNLIYLNVRVGQAERAIVTLLLPLLVLFR